MTTPKPRNKGTADFVRGLCAKLGRFRKSDLWDETWERNIAWPRVGSVLRDFMRSGEIRPAGEEPRAKPRKGRQAPLTENVYEYAGPKLRGSGVRERVYRGMHVKGLFTVRDIVVLSDADSSYICSLVRSLVKTGDIERAGKTPGPARPEPAYRVRNRDEFFLKFVRGLSGQAPREKRRDLREAWK